MEAAVDERLAGRADVVTRLREVGGDGVAPGPAPPPGEGSLFGDIAQVLDELLSLRERAGALGEPVCAVYVEGSAEALRTARDHLRLGCFRDPSGLGPGVIQLQCAAVALRARDDGGLADFGGLSEKDGVVAFVPGGDADEEPWSSAADLGSALLDDADLVAFAGRPWAAALLADALCSHEWLHMASGETRSLTRSAAYALVRVAAGGRGFPELDAGETRGLVDVRVAGMLARLGWRRLRGPQVH